VFSQRDGGLAREAFRQGQTRPEGSCCRLEPRGACVGSWRRHRTETQRRISTRLGLRLFRSQARLPPSRIPVASSERPRLVAPLARSDLLISHGALVRRCTNSAIQTDAAISPAPGERRTAQLGNVIFFSWLIVWSNPQPGFLLSETWHCARPPGADCARVDIAERVARPCATRTQLDSGWGSLGCKVYKTTGGWPSFRPP